MQVTWATSPIVALAIAIKRKTRKGHKKRKAKDKTGQPLMVLERQRTSMIDGDLGRNGSSTTIVHRRLHYRKEEEARVNLMFLQLGWCIALLGQAQSSREKNWNLKSRSYYFRLMSHTQLSVSAKAVLAKQKMKSIWGLNNGLLN